MLVTKVWVLLLIAASCQAKFCHQIDQCSCKMSDTGKIVSLWNINGANEPTFQKIKQHKANPYSLDFFFTYNPCTAFNKGPTKGCRETLVCQNNGKETDFYSVGTPKTFTPTVVGDSVVFKYQGIMEAYVKRHVDITLKCDANAKTPSMSSPVEDTLEGGFYRFNLTTECACPGACVKGAGNGLSTGSILLILLFVLVLVYFVSGFVLLKFVNKKEGTETIPQYEFWKDFPAKVKDGFVFTKDKIQEKRKGGGEYEQI